MSIFQRLLRPILNDSARSTKPENRIRPSRLGLGLEILEDRITPSGRGVVFLVNGGNGGTIPDAVDRHIANDLFPKAAFPNGWNVYVTNWNSPDPTTTSGFPGAFGAGDPTKFGFPVLIDHQNILGVDVPTGLNVQPFATPNPVSPEQFVANLTNILDTQYDDKDFVALIGHSLGGNSVLEVANRTHRKIDLLATLDPVGFSFDTSGAGINIEVTPGYGLGGIQFVPAISFNIPLGELQGAFDPSFFDPARGFPGYGKSLVGPNQGNVKYFYNRWQDKFVFPLDRNVSRDLQNLNVQDDVSAISYLGEPIAAQAVSDTQLNGDGTVNEHNPTFEDIV
jgi:pimeloyl-ACP methyl ester carboxylesterase